MQLGESIGRPAASSRMGNREEPSRDDVLLSMVCPAVEAMRRNPPLPIDVERSEPTPSRPARSPAVSSAAPNSLGPGMGISDLWAVITSKSDRERNCCSGVGCSVRHPAPGSQINPCSSGRFNSARRRGARPCTEAARFRPSVALARFLPCKARRTTFLFFPPTSMRRK
jgi:hypothetical protein